MQFDVDADGVPELTPWTVDGLEAWRKFDKINGAQAAEPNQRLALIFKIKDTADPRKLALFLDQSGVTDTAQPL